MNYYSIQVLKSQFLNKFNMWAYGTVLESIIDKPKGLIKVELRVFCPEKIQKKYKFSNPVHLFTDIVPKIHGYELGLPIIDFGLPRGLSYSCTDLWTQLLAGVWKVR